MAIHPLLIARFLRSLIQKTCGPFVEKLEIIAFVSILG